MTSSTQRLAWSVGGTIAAATLAFAVFESFPSRGAQRLDSPSGEIGRDTSDLAKKLDHDREIPQRVPKLERREDADALTDDTDVLVRGVVVDDVGSPVTPVDVRAIGHSRDGAARRLKSQSDGGGRFQVAASPAMPDLATVDLIVFARRASFPLAYTRGVRPGDERVRIALPKPRWLKLRVHDIAGSDVAHFSAFVDTGMRREEVRALWGVLDPFDAHTVLVAPARVESRSAVVNAREDRISSDVIEIPNASFWLNVEAEGFLDAEFENVDPASVGANLDVTLHRKPRLRGRVISKGIPVPGARVHGRVGPRWGVPIETVTKADGCFEVVADSSSVFDITAEAVGFVPTTIRGVSLELDSDSERVDWILKPGATLTGQVTRTAALDAFDFYVVAMMHGARARWTAVDADGRFAMSALAPGTWEVFLCSELGVGQVKGVADPPDPESYARAECELVDDETTTRDFIASVPVRRLDATIEIKPDPGPDVTLDARLVGSAVHPQGTTAVVHSNEAFTLYALEDGRYTLRVEIVGRSGSERLEWPVTLEGPVSMWNSVVNCGSLEVNLVPGEFCPGDSCGMTRELQYEFEGADGLRGVVKGDVSIESHFKWPWTPMSSGTLSNRDSVNAPAGSVAIRVESGVSVTGALQCKHNAPERSEKHR